MNGVRAYFAAAGVMAEVQKRNSLVHLLGSEGQRQSGTITGFQLFDAEQTFDAAVTALDAHFKTKTNAMVERRKFRGRVQHVGESAQDFVVALRELAATCKFDTLEEQMIRDQFVEHNSNRRVRERLYQEPDTLTLENAVLIATGIEAAIFESKGRDVVAQIGRQAKTQRRPAPPPATKCGRCGRSHDKLPCPARDKTCNTCRKVGHFSVVCRSSKRVSGVRPGDDGASDMGLLSVGAGTSRNDYYYISCKIKGHSISMMVDSGAKVSVINKATYQRMQSTAHRATAAKLSGYGDAAIPLVGTVDLPIAYKDKTVDNARFYITLKGENLIGLDLFGPLGLKISDGPDPVSLIATHDGDELRLQFSSLFEGLGHVKGYSHRPSIDSSVKPVVQAPRRVPLALVEEVQDELRAMLRDGVIERVEASPWVSNLVVSRRSNGKVRLCTDLRNANKSVISGKYPVPTVDKLSAQVQGGTVFSKLDLCSGYSQMSLTSWLAT